MQATRSSLLKLDHLRNDSNFTLELGHRDLVLPIESLFYILNLLLELFTTAKHTAVLTRLSTYPAATSARVVVYRKVDRFESVNQCDGSLSNYIICVLSGFSILL